MIKQKEFYLPQILETQETLDGITVLERIFTIILLDHF